LSARGRRPLAASRSPPDGVDPGLHRGIGPVFLEPRWWWVSDSADLELLVLVATTVREHLQGVWELVVDLETVTVGITKIDAALVFVVGRAFNRDSVLEQMQVGVTESRMAVHLKRDVHQTQLAFDWLLRPLWIWMLGEIERVEVLTQRREHATMLWITFGDA
jgi:hypothetical protein